MIPTIPHDLILSFIVGALGCLSARGEIVESRSSIRNAPFLRVLAFQCLVFVPIGVHLAVFFPSWSWMYFVDGESIAAHWTGLAVLGYVVSMAVGFLFAERAVRQERLLDVHVAIAIGILVVAVLTVTQIDRLARVGTYAEFVAERAPSVWDSPEFLASVLVWGPYFALGFAVLVGINLGLLDLGRRAR